jgi:tetratricopeptide (TPR) repeat protein
MDFKTQKEKESAALNEKIEKLQKDLTSAQELSYRLVQEKSGFEGQQNQSAAKIAELSNLKANFEQERQKLLEQNEFLKNQYVGIQQEMTEMKNRYAKLEKERDAALQVSQKDKKVLELESQRKELAKKLEEYSQQIKDYETKLKDRTALEKQNKILAEDYAQVKDDYEKLKLQYQVTSKESQIHKAVVKRSGSLPEENATLHYNLGVMSAQQGEYAKAVSEFEKVLQLKPDDAETHYNLGVIFSEHLNDRKKAVAHFKRYLALAPDDPDAERVRRFMLTWETFDQEIAP